MIKTLSFNKLSRRCFPADVFAYSHQISSGLACEWYLKDVRMLLLKIYNSPP